MSNPLITGQEAITIFNSVAAETAITGTTEAAFVNTVTIDAGTLAVGNIIRLDCAGSCTLDGNATNLTLKVRLATVTGTVIATFLLIAGTVSVANCFSLAASWVVRAIGASGSIMPVSGLFTKSTAAAASVIQSLNDVAATTVDTTANIVLVPTILMSASQSFVPQNTRCSIARLGI